MHTETLPKSTRKILSDNGKSQPNCATADAMWCRLCHGHTNAAFKTELMGKHAVEYSVCETCGSLQTEMPFWLDEAYASNLGDLDCGAAQRNLHSFAASFSMAKIWGIKTAIDFGGGDGLLTRLLRDRQVDCYVEDKYGSPTYALAFADTSNIRPDAIFAFEVFEHFVDPQGEIADLFNQRPAIVFGTTERFAGQGADWWYLSRKSGHHVFFYSHKAMEHVARTHGYRLVQKAAFFLFVRKDKYNPVKAAISRLMLTSLARRLVIAAAAFTPATGVGKDTDYLSKAQ